MTRIHTIPATQQTIEIVDVQFVNLYTLVEEFKARLNNYHFVEGVLDVMGIPGNIQRIETPESLKYHDLCIGTLNTGHVFIGESCPARVEEYNRELAHSLSEKAMMNQVYAMRSYLIKEERSGNAMKDFIPGYTAATSGYTFHLPFEINEWYLPLYQLLKFPEGTPPVVLAIGVLPNTYTVIGIAQSPNNEEYHQRFNDLCGNAMLNVYLKTQELYSKHYMLQNFNK